MTARDDFFERAKAAPVLDVARTLGAELRRGPTGEMVGACPIGCCKTDGFQVNEKKGVFLCRQSGAGGGPIEMAAHILGLDPAKEYVRICEAILNESAPGRDDAERSVDVAVLKERREERRDEAAQREKEEASAEDRKRAEHIRKATAMFDSGVPIEGTIAQDYFEEWRKLDLLRCDTRNLRFRNSLGYWDGEREIGQFPCILEAARDLSGAITGIKRVYLDRSGQKLKSSAIGGGAAKKGTFTMGGSLIYLDEPGPLLALAEGVETAIAHKMLACIGTFGDEWAHETIAAADSLGNLTSDTLMLPPVVKQLILIGDADSDPRMTRGALLKAAERFEALGVQTFVHMSRPGTDWNDVVVELSRQAVAA